MLHKWSRFVALAALLVGLYGGVALANQDEDTDETRARTLSRCVGGPVKRVYGVSENAATTQVESPDNADTFNVLPGASVPFAGPVSASDTIVVTFSGECRLLNASSNDWVEIEVLLDGVPIPPTGGPSPMAFCSDGNWSMHSVTVCRPVGPGNHVVSVRWKLVDSTPAAALQGWLDDWTLMVTVHD